MTFKLRASDFRTLEHLADHRILTMSQLATVLQKNRHAVRKRVRGLRQEGFVEVTTNEFGQSFGRPESLLGLTEHRVKLPALPQTDLGRLAPFEWTAP